MQDKERHIEYWKLSAADDLEAIDFLLNGKKYVQSLFFTHLSLEKILKALWVQNNENNIPPKTHNLYFLYQECGVELNEDDTDFLQKLNTFQIEGRYPDYLTNLYKTTFETETKTIISQAKKLFTCLQEKLP